MYGYIGRIQRGIPYSPPSSPESPEHRVIPDLVGENDTLTSPSSTSSLPPTAEDSWPHSAPSINALRKIYRIASRNPSQLVRPPSHVTQQQMAGEETPGSGTSQFDSLQDLLERAGYKETRVITPDRQTSIKMAARAQREPSSNHGGLLPYRQTPPPSEAAASLRQAIQRTFSDERKPAPAATRQLRNTKSSGWLFGAFWTADAAASTRSSVPLLPSIHITPSNDADQDGQTHPGQSTAATDYVSDERAFAMPVSSPGKRSSPAASRSSSETVSAGSPSNTTPSPKRPRARVELAGQGYSRPSLSRTARKSASKIQLWQGSLAYRSTHSQTAPVRTKDSHQFNATEGLETAEAAESFTHMCNAARKGKKRTGLAEAFAESPSKPRPASSGGSEASPETQRRWRNERFAWQESLQGLNSFSNPKPEMVSEELSTVAIAVTVACEVEVAVDDATLSELLAGPAPPILSMNPAVALRNESCLRPSYLRRMQSVDVLNKALSDCERRQKGQVIAQTPTGEGDRVLKGQGATPRPASLTLAKPPPPPTLMISSPSGIHSPKVLELDGTEFEPRSWSPLKGQTLVSSRRVVKRKSGQRLNAPQRSSSAGASAATATDGAAGLDAARGRSSSRRDRRSGRESQHTSPTHGAIRPSNKSEAGSIRVRAHAGASAGSGSAAMRAPQQGERQPFAFGSAANAVHGHEEDPFRSDGTLPSAFRKKAFMQSLSRGSKIAKLIEETNRRPLMVTDENSFVAASHDSPTSRVSANRRSKGAFASVPLRSRYSRIAAIDANDDDGLPRLSSSLSRSSARRMEALTSALHQNTKKSEL
ncbi:hypothetical protein ACQY0O_000856 [Thecaphora frezii]